MFFKKKKVMGENIEQNKNIINENADNLAQKQEMEELLGNILNTDDSQPVSEMPDEGNDEELEKVRAELSEAKDKHIRLIAEFENYKRRTAKERNELSQTAGKDIIQSLLVVLDDMGRAEKQIDNTTDVTAIKEGIALVFNK